ncbi:MAG TPA: hypothetical protein VN377_03585 [Candidatus Thermoplasmatota archaeon]|nr:hypothetical protein [Candidatus Thermoplasmatota archaeon]
MINIPDHIIIGLPPSFLLTILISIIRKQDNEEEILMNKSFGNI